MSCQKYDHVITTFISPEEGYKPVYFSFHPFAVIIKASRGREFLEGEWFYERGHWWYKVLNTGSEELMFSLLGKRNYDYYE